MRVLCVCGFVVTLELSIPIITIIAITTTVTMVTIITGAT